MTDQSTSTAQASQPFDARADAIARNMQRRLSTNAGSETNESVTNGASSHTVVFKRSEPDAKYGVSILTSWSTTVFIPPSDKTKDGFIVHFGTAAGAAAVIDYLTFRAG